MGCSLLSLVRCKSANLYIMYSLAGYLIDLRGVSRGASGVCGISTYPTHHALQGDVCQDKNPFQSMVTISCALLYDFFSDYLCRISYPRQDVMIFFSP
jgi:hypothetical protein